MDMVHFHLFISKIPAQQIFKSAAKFDGVLLSLFWSVRFFGRNPDKWYFASLRGAGGPNRCNSFCAAAPLTISTRLLFGFYLLSFFPGLTWEAFVGDCWGVTICIPHFCLCPLNWWSIISLYPCHISLNCTGHHLLGHNWCKMRFCARQQPRAALPYIFVCIKIGQGPSCSWAHLGHTAAELHLWAPCPHFRNLKQHNGLGTKGSTFTLKYPMQTSFGRLELQKVKNSVNSFSWPWSLILTCSTDVTPCALNSNVRFSHAG